MLEHQYAIVNVYKAGCILETKKWHCVQMPNILDTYGAMQSENIVDHFQDPHMRTKLLHESQDKVLWFSFFLCYPNGEHSCLQYNLIPYYNVDLVSCDPSELATNTYRALI